MDHGRTGRDNVHWGQWPDYVLSIPARPVRRLSMLWVLHHMIYYTTKGAAQALADTLAAQDDDAWVYEVHASPRGFYVAVFDFDHFFLGNL